MTQTKAGGWIAATVVIGIMLALAAWFLAISPTLATAADTEAQAQSQVEQNLLTKRKNAQLKAQFENIDALQAELDGLRLQIPTGADMANYRRQLDAVAKSHSVTIVSVQSATPAVIEAPVAAPVVPEDPAAATNAESSSEADPVPAVKSDPVYAIPLSLEAMGSYDNVLAFLQDLQVGTQRLFLVEQINADAPAPSEASGGRPAVVEGDLHVAINGSVYVLAAPPTEVPVADGAAAPAPPALPAPNGRNPLLPLH